MLLSDAFGGFGGISQYNRDLLDTLCGLDEVASVEALPRVVHGPLGELPAGLTFNTSGTGSQLRYVRTAMMRGLFGPKPDIVLCGHINLLPLGYAIAKARGARLVLLIFGIDAWQPTPGKLANALTGKVDLLLSISRITLDRYLEWAPPPRGGSVILPNAIHLEQYGVGPKAPDLVEQFGLAGRKVVMTFGRMASGEQMKGFDEMIEAMPRLLGREPDLTYLIAGTGDDVDRLRAKADSLGVGERVIFTGLVPEDRKADYFRLADAYAMPSHGEGFGFVFLEAMACGIPVVASRTDGGFEAIREGQLGIAVNPADPDEICRGVLDCLNMPREIPADLSYFAYPEFIERTRQSLFGHRVPALPRNAKSQIPQGAPR